MKFLPILATVASLSMSTSAYGQMITPLPIRIANRRLPQVRVIRNGTKLRIKHGDIIQTIQADSLKVRVLDSFTCEGKQVKRRTLSGKQFLPQATKLNKKTGDLVVGVLLQNCVGKNISAVFIIQPKPNWNNYVVHRVPVPGKRQLKSKFSTYPLGIIKQIRFLDGNLLIKHVDSKKSEALLVYTLSNQPIVKFTGCVVTLQKGSNICPSF